ncbi:MAG: ComF family protein [Candidatus Acetothermia bacterium]|jgi:ComF family protein|nr:ComF family protein [Candidatus Acetothermia bacterium]MDH7505216.1 ComF family protein [Candidatus Acetothermia bacterium]
MTVAERSAVLLDQFARGALKLLYPPHCYLCGKPLEDGLLCLSCYSGLPRPRPDEPGCARCGAPLADPAADLCKECADRPWFFTEARSFGYYEAGLAELIKGLKFGGERALARELARYLLEAGAELLPRVEALTFVPMTRRKERERGFNQAELLARQLGRLAGLPVVSALAKVRETLEQTALGPEERRANVRGAFASCLEAEHGAILLIDDVYTTGATAEECSRALREAGYEEVYVLTVARAGAREASDEARS